MFSHSICPKFVARYKSPLLISCFFYCWNFTTTIKQETGFHLSAKDLALIYDFHYLKSRLNLIYAQNLNVLLNFPQSKLINCKNSIQTKKTSN